MSDEETEVLRYGDIVVIEKDGSRGNVFPFMGRALIGRMESCDIRIRLGYISRKHAFVSVDENGSIILEDLSNKQDMTLLNNEPVLGKRVQLKNGDIFSIADRRFLWACSDLYMRPSKECISVMPKKKPEVLKQNSGLMNKASTPQPKKQKSPAPRRKSAVPTPLRKQIVAKAEAKTAGVKSYLPTPIRKQIVAHRDDDEVPTPEETQKTALPTPVRKQIVERSGPVAKRSALPTPLRREIQKKEKDEQAFQVKKSALSTPVRAQIVEKRRKSTRIATKKSALPTPVRREILATGNEEVLIAATTKKSALPTPVRQEILASKRVDDEQVFEVKKSALATPVRKQIVEKRRKSTRVATKKSALPTPVRQEILAARRTNLDEPNAKEEESAQPVPSVTTENANAEHTFEAKKSALSTPVRKQIVEKRRRSTRVAAKKSALPTPVRQDIVNCNKERTFAEKKSALSSPVRKQIVEKRRKSTRIAKKKSALPTPVRQEILAERKEETQMGQPSPQPPLKSFLPTPPRQETLAADTEHAEMEEEPLPAPPMKSALPTPVRQEILTRDRAPIQEHKFGLPTPLRQMIETRRCPHKPTHPHHSPHTPLLLSQAHSGQQGEEDEEEITIIKSALPTPLRREITKREPKPDVAKPKALPTPLRRSIRNQHKQGKADVGQENTDDGISEENRHRLSLEARLKDYGLDTSVYQDWSIGDLEQRFNSLELKNDELVVADWPPAGSPKFVPYEGKRTEFNTPNDSKTQEYKYRVHWTYSDYSGNEESETEDEREPPAQQDDLSEAFKDLEITDKSSEKKGEDEIVFALHTPRRRKSMRLRCKQELVVEDEVVDIKAPPSRRKSLPLDEMKARAVVEETPLVGEDVDVNSQVEVTENEQVEGLQVEEELSSEVETTRLCKESEESISTETKAMEIDEVEAAEDAEEESTGGEEVEERAESVAVEKSTVAGEENVEEEATPVEDELEGSTESGAIKEKNAKEEAIPMGDEVSESAESDAIEDEAVDEEENVREEAIPMGNDVSESAESVAAEDETGAEEENAKEKSPRNCELGTGTQCEEETRTPGGREDEAVATNASTYGQCEGNPLVPETVEKTEVTEEQTAAMGGEQEATGTEDEAARATVHVYFSKLRVSDLRPLIKKHSLDPKGKKAELVDRLVELFLSMSSQDQQSSFPEIDSTVFKSETQEAEETAAVEEVETRERKTILIPSQLKVAELKSHLSAREGVDEKTFKGKKKAELVRQLQDLIIQEEKNFVEKSNDGEVFMKEEHDLLWKPVTVREFDAVVVGFLPKTPEEPEELFRVRFLDGEVEDMELAELTEAINHFKAKH